MLTRTLLWIGAALSAAVGAIHVWGAAQFVRVVLPAGSDGGLGAVSAGIGPMMILYWIAGIVVNRVVAGRARRAGGRARSLHKAHLALSFGFAAVTIGALALLAARGRSLGAHTVLAMIAAQTTLFGACFLLLAAVLLMLGRTGRQVSRPGAPSSPSRQV